MASTPKAKALEKFKSFLDRLQQHEVFTKYSKPKLTASKEELVFTAEGVDEQAPKDPWTTYVVWKKGTGNLFYFREYRDGGYQTQKTGTRAKGDDDIGK